MTKVMESVNELNIKILNVTMVIQEKYPELTKYLNEMPVIIYDTKSPVINSMNLRAYYDSLNSLVEQYMQGLLSESSK